MLNSFRTGVLALAASVCLASVAQAEEHEVIIVEGAYFPPLIYAEVGDTLVFVNETGSVHVVQASDESWTSGPISANGSFTLLLEDDTQLLFNASAETEGDGDGTGDEWLEQVGEITFDAAPSQ